MCANIKSRKHLLAQFYITLTCLPAQCWAPQLNFLSFFTFQPLLSPFSKTNLPYWKPAWDYSKGNLIGYVQNTSVGTSACMCAFNTFVTQVFCYLLSHFPSHPCFLCSSFTASQNILFLSMAEFRADKGVGGSGGSYIMGFSCQIGSKSFL